MTPPVVCIVGKKKSGKTTLIEKLIPALGRLGLSVGTVKHDAHSFDMDVKGKDTWRHREAGASSVAISSPSRVAVIHEVSQELSLDDVAERFFGERDIIIAEGFYNSGSPKIEVFRPESHKQPLTSAENAWCRNVLAMVTDADIDPGVPVIGLENADKLAEFVKDWFSL